jgi:uncharacterized membrane protein
VPVPRPHGRQLYLKLRDDPSVVHTLELPQKKDAATHRDDKPATASPAPAAVQPPAQNTVPAQSTPAATQSSSAPAKAPSAAPPPANSPHP